MNPRRPWFWLFIFVNIAAAIIMMSTGELIGDLAGQNLHSRSALLMALALILASYYFLLGPLFNFVTRIKVHSLNFKGSESHAANNIGIFLALMQILFIFFNVSNGINIAGSNNITTQSSFSLFWVAFPVDALFLIYYGTYRESRYFYVNLLIWIISNTLRGWAGIFFAIIFLEWCRAVRNGKLSITKIGFLVLFVICLYPVLSNLKWIIRAASGTDLSLTTIVDGLSISLVGSDYFTLISDGLMHLIGRLQTTSMMIDVIRISDFLQDRFEAGDFAPFWKEGLHGIFYDRLFSEKKQDYIGVAFTSYETFNFDYKVGDWNVSLGYPSWFFISPVLIFIYIGYTCLLAFVSYYLLKKIGFTQLTADLLWYTWLVYLLAPWFLPFTNFIYAILVFMMIKVVASIVPNIKY
jgi:hypothetical protein